MLIAAAAPVIDNPPRYRLAPGEPLFDLPTLPVALERAKRTWRNYGGYAFDFFTSLHGRHTVPLGAVRRGCGGRKTAHGFLGVCPA
jgi:hypothetical protein